jgi:neutral ceramidase
MAGVLALGLHTVVQAKEVSTQYEVGVGRYDITGPAAEMEMMGYARAEQKDTGIHQRLWSRAFVFVDPATAKRVAFVSVDLGMAFQAVKQGVVKLLKQRHIDGYDDNNILISATHTHSGPAGYAHHALFNITALGFDKDNYQAVVSGIAESIILADQHKKTGRVFWNAGELLGANGNRSIKAYLKNPASERARYAYPVDKTMSLLRLDDMSGQPIGMVNWFAVHGVSMSPENTLISGDNKGYASYLFEREKGADFVGAKGFVAAFAQANEGDVTPNIFGQAFDGQCLNFRCGDMQRTSRVAHLQLARAQSLYQTAKEQVTGPIDYRQQYIDMSAQPVAASLVGQAHAHTCVPALGYAFGAGTTDGPGPDIFYQGELKGNPLVDVLRNWLTPPTQTELACQMPKPVLLSVGTNKPYAWVPTRMPVQILQLGSVAILAVPGEMTTMSGRRLREYIKPFLPKTIQHVVIAGLANAYAGYIADPDEYLQQNYEGGFTVFGRWTLPAYMQAFAKIAKDLRDGRETPAGPQPEDLSQHQLSFIPKVVFDDVPLGKHFGDVITQPLASYQPNAVVSVKFWGAHPRNNLETQQGYLAVQRLVDGQWQTVLHDYDWDTIYQWQRVGLSYSQITIAWHVAAGTPAGTYRILQRGSYKYGWNGRIYPYQGVTRPFQITS